MADFLRPEVRAALFRLREVIAGAALAALGLWWAVTAFGLLRWVGVVLIAAGAALVFAAAQRLRFGATGGGAGVVSLDEGRLAYFGPVTGGILDLGDLVSLTWDTGQWILVGQDGTRLAIPADAEGAERLFDAFAALPGLSSQRLVTARAAPDGVAVPVWRRAAPGRRIGGTDHEPLPPDRQVH